MVPTASNSNAWNPKCHFNDSDQNVTPSSWVEGVRPIILGLEFEGLWFVTIFNRQLWKQLNQSYKLIPVSTITNIKPSSANLCNLNKIWIIIMANKTSCDLTSAYVCDLLSSFSTCLHSSLALLAFLMSLIYSIVGCLYLLSFLIFPWLTLSTGGSIWGLYIIGRLPWPLS